MEELWGDMGGIFMGKKLEDTKRSFIPSSPINAFYSRNRKKLQL